MSDVRASYIIVTSTLLSYKMLISGDDTMQFNACTMLHARAYIRESRRTDRRVAEVNLLDVAKENMIGVVYEILPLAVINSEQTVAPGCHDLWDNATFCYDMHNEFLQSCIRLNMSQKKRIATQQTRLIIYCERFSDRKSVV